MGGVISQAPPLRLARVGRSPQAADFSADLAGVGQVRFPGSTPTSTRRTTTNPHPHLAAVDLASLLDGSRAGELIPEIVRNGLQRLIQLELAAFLGADWHERTEERLGHRHGYRTRTLTIQVGAIALQIP